MAETQTALTDMIARLEWLGVGFAVAVAAVLVLTYLRTRARVQAD